MKQQNGSERREYFRINDMIALQAESLSNEDAERADELYEIRWRDTGFSSEISYNREKHQPTMIQIERKYPEVATYISYLEEELQRVIQRLGTEESKLPGKPTHQVNLSAGGLLFLSHKEFATDSLIELNIRLFPSRNPIFAYARVIRCEATDSDVSEGWDIATKFTHVHEEDQEALIKHIHKWQMSRLRVRDVG